MSGNGLFQTLGNVTVNPHSGLLVVDWVTGNMLQLTGRAQIVWVALAVSALAGVGVDRLARPGPVRLRGALVAMAWLVLIFTKALIFIIAIVGTASARSYGQLARGLILGLAGPFLALFAFFAAVSAYG